MAARPHPRRARHHRGRHGGHRPGDHLRPGVEPLPNRVDGPDDGRTALNRWRIKAITTESGGQILVTYSGPDCTREAPPTPHTNTQRCMPAYYSLAGEPTLDWFHKYVVTRIDMDDTVTDQPNQSIFYDYLDSPAWHYNTDELTKDAHRTWGDWRGYGRVRVRYGDPSTGAQTAVEYRYLRGMDGDKQPTGTRDVWVTDSWGGSIEDHEALHGFQLQQITFNGPTGPEVGSNRNDPWKAGPTATRTRNGITTNAWKTNTETTRSRTALTGGAYRTAKTSTAYNNDGLPVPIDSFGDENVTGDETCTRTSYARNDTTWMIDRVSQIETLSGTCAAASTPPNPATVLSRSRSFYDSYVDESSFGAEPSRGNVVRTEVLDSWNGSTPVYVATSRDHAYDDNGRGTAVTDARGNTTTTAYTTANGGLVTQTVVTNPLTHIVTLVTEPAWGLPTRTTDPNGLFADMTYDGLGRLTAVWQPGRNKATQTPNLKFTYLVRNSGGPTAITTESLLPTAAYLKSINLFDGFLRQRQTQTQATGGGRLLTDALYNTRGETAWISRPYYDSTNTPPGTSLGQPQGQIPSLTQYVYDGAGRPTALILKALGAEKWRTTIGYGGDRVHATPPSGGISTTAITNIFDETIELRQYKNPANVGSGDPSTFHSTRYGYDLEGALTQHTDPAGNQWTYRYDLRGRLTEAIDPDKGTTTSSYDAAGDLQTSTSPLGTGTATLAYTYDALGRATSLRDGSPTGPVRTEWVYDTAPNGVGKLAKSIRRVGASAYESRVVGYDTAGRATGTSVVLPTSEGALCAAAAPTPCTYTTTLTYRVNGAPHQATLPAAANLPSEKLTFGYTDIGQASGLLSASQIYVYGVAYNKIGQLTQRTLGAFGKRVAITSTFDEPTRRRTGTNVVPELQPEAAKWGYGYDNAGNITKLTEAPAGQPADTQCFAYDYLRQLTEAWTPGSGNCTTPASVAGLGGPAPYWHSWTHNAIGNRLTEVRHAAGGNTTYTYSYPNSGPSSVRPHALTQVQMSAPGSTWTHGYGYDNAGNTKTRLSNAGNQQTLTFDREGHLTSLTEAGQSNSYVYDAAGNRLIRRDPSGTTLYLPNGTEVRVAAGTSTATATRYYRHQGTSIAVRTAAGLSWIVGDHHGTAELSLNATTLAVAKRRSLPYGQARGTTTGTWAAGMDKGFVGGTTDNTGLTHMGAREYDPAIGRFISIDPIMDLADPQQWQGYNYANNNPTTWADPSGLAKEEMSAGAMWSGGTAPSCTKGFWECLSNSPLAYFPILGTAIEAGATVYYVSQGDFDKALEHGATIIVGGAGKAVMHIGGKIIKFAVDKTRKTPDIPGATVKNPYGASHVDDPVDDVGDIKNHTRNKPPAPAEPPAPGKASTGTPNTSQTPASCNSFHPDTPVLMADSTTKTIEQLRVGDVVLATDPETGRTAAKTVVATITGHGTKQLVEITIDIDGGAGDATAKLIATDGHPFWVPALNKWIDATDLNPGTWLRTAAGTWVQITAIKRWTQTATVHNLTVTDIHTYYVVAGDSAVLVHNSNSTCGFHAGDRGADATDCGPSCPRYQAPPAPEPRPSTLTRSDPDKWQNVIGDPLKAVDIPDTDGGSAPKWKRLIKVLLDLADDTFDHGNG